MKNLSCLLMVILSCCHLRLFSQRIKKQTDKHIVNQQERMVFKQWDRKKFTPTKGFLSLNYQYWLTWAWHPNYPKKDLRPLGPTGPQSQRLLLVAAMQNTEEAYKKQADTIGLNALGQLSNYLGSMSDMDPLWNLYYQKEFKQLLNPDTQFPLHNTTPEVRQYLLNTGALDWFMQQKEILSQRLQGTKDANMDRGTRILTYHRLMLESRELFALWDNKKNNAARFISIGRSVPGKEHAGSMPAYLPKRSDKQIADDVIRNSKL